MKELYTNNIERFGEGRERLLQLEKTGLYLFHGTEKSSLRELTPSLPHTIKDGIREPHGDRPTISATPSADMAIFYAVVTHDYREVSYDDQSATYRATKKALEYAQECTGFVYIVDRSAFSYPVGSSPLTEIRTDHSVKVLGVVPVRYQDLGMEIALLPPFSHKP